MKIFICFSLLFSFCFSNPEKEYEIFNFNKTSMVVEIPIDNLNLSNSNFSTTRLTIDTMSFYTKLFQEYINDINNIDLGQLKAISSINTYRSFRGAEIEGNFTKYKSSFPFVIFTEFNFNEKRYIQNLQNNSCGSLGLARVYSPDVLVGEKYFFGVGEKYSFINYLFRENAYPKRIFSVYKDNFIIGKSFIDTNNNSVIGTKCFCQDNLEYSYTFFFWNCEVSKVEVLGKQMTISQTLIIDSLLKGVIFPYKVLYEMISPISKLTNDKCKVEDRIKCDKNVDISIFGSMTITFVTNYTIELNLTNFFFFDENKNSYDSYIEFSQYSEAITIGKWIFEKYYVEFNKDENYLALASLDKVKIELKSLNSNNRIIIQILIFVNIGLMVLCLLYYMSIFKYFD